MITNHDVKESRSNSLNRSNSIRRSNALMVDDAEDTPAEENATSTRCCGAG